MFPTEILNLHPGIGFLEDGDDLVFGVAGHLHLLLLLEYLNSKADVTAYLTAVLEENDAALLTAALGDMARARGMSQVARDSGIAREALYQGLRADGQPRFETISRVCAIDVLGVGPVVALVTVPRGRFPRKENP